ncbi:MAG TPA: hypothetical protein DCR04_07730 [Flavobacteriales bacterium]|nr:hypothetical protein [Flavobacteriales bacterium]
MAQVSVNTTLPATVAPGGSFTVELDVAKGDVSGFAKLQQNLPPGFSAEQGESANATFSFKDQKVKFLWMALPNNNFQVSYKVNVDASLSGNQIIEGTFAYIQDNETEKYVIPKDIISVGANQADAANQAAMDKILADQQAKEDAAETARKEAASAEETEEVAAVEEVTEVVEEVAEPIVEAVEEIAEEVVEAVEEVVEATPAPAKTVEPVADYNDAMMKSKAGLVFRVQVAAGPSQVDPSFFVNKYGISDAIVIEEHEGLFKYVVGEFGSYRPAKTFSNELRDNNSVEGPFVTAYNDGVRIHVKEALDIAGQ